MNRCNLYEADFLRLSGWPMPPVRSRRFFLGIYFFVVFVFGIAGCGVQESVVANRLADARSSDESASLVVSGTSVVLLPISMSIKRGSVSSQPLSVLGRQDQSGFDDVWSNYVEFTPAPSGVTAIFNYNLPDAFPLSSLSGLQLEVNYKGQVATAQKWTFALFDQTTRTWVIVGSNSFASDWQWSPGSLAVSGNLSRFFNSSRKIQLRYMTSSAIDASALDYLVLKVFASGSSGGSLSPTVSPSPTPTPAPTLSPQPSATPSTANWWKPAQGLTWQMQYSGTIDTSLNVQVYMLDMFGTAAPVISALKSRGVKVVCYIDGGSWESYTPDAGQFPESILGKVVGGWPDERFVDIRSKDLLWPIMRARLDLAKQKGCDGIYHDWADSFMQDTGFPLTASDQLTYNRFWISEAHGRGMSVGLINDLLQVAELADEYDWGLNESCMNYNECSYLKPFIDLGKPVFALQYSGDPAVYCPKLNALNFDALFKKVDLDAYRLPCR